MVRIRVNSSGWRFNHFGGPYTFLKATDAAHDLHLQKNDTSVLVRARRRIWPGLVIPAIAFACMIVVIIHLSMDERAWQLLGWLALPLASLLLLGYVTFCPRSVEFHTDSASLIYRIGGLRKFVKKFKLRSDSKLTLLEFRWVSGGPEEPPKLRPLDDPYQDVQMFVLRICPVDGKVIDPFVTESEDLAEQFIAEVELSLENLADSES